MNLAFLFALACAPAPSTGIAPATSGGEDCSRYSADTDAYGYCMALGAGTLDRAPAEARCLQAGTWENDCRSRWVTARLRELGGPPSPSGMGELTDDPDRVHRADELLDFCKDDDCRFLVVDRFRDIDLANQLRRCVNVGSYAPDCATHAVQGWQEHRASVAEVDALWAAIPRLPPPFADRAAEAAGYGYACAEATCPADGRASACERGWTAAREKGCEATARPGAASPGPVGTPPR